MLCWQVLGDFLPNIGLSGTTSTLPSPEQLRGKILIKNKPVHSDGALHQLSRRQSSALEFASQEPIDEDGGLATVQEEQYFDVTTDAHNRPVLRLRSGSLEIAAPLPGRPVLISPMQGMPPCLPGMQVKAVCFSPALFGTKTSIVAVAVSSMLAPAESVRGKVALIQRTRFVPSALDVSKTEILFDKCLTAAQNGAVGVLIVNYESVIHIHVNASPDRDKSKVQIPVGLIVPEDLTVVLGNQLYLDFANNYLGVYQKLGYLLPICRC